MPKALPEETRLKIVELKARGLNLDQTAAELNVSKSAVRRWLGRYQTTGMVAELPRSRRPHSTDAEQDATLVAAAEAEHTRTIRNVSLTLNQPYRTSLRRIHQAGLVLRKMRQRELDRMEKIRLV